MMHEHPCADVRELLEAFHDGEVSIDWRIAIQKHLSECVACSLAAEELTAVSASLREFHDAFLAQGGVPIRLVRKLLFEQR